MNRVLMIGAGGVATVAAFKIVQNQDVFNELIIASRRKEKCESNSQQRLQSKHQNSPSGCRRR